MSAVRGRTLVALALAGLATGGCTLLSPAADPTIAAPATGDTGSDAAGAAPSAAVDDPGLPASTDAGFVEVVDTDRVDAALVADGLAVVARQCEPGEGYTVTHEPDVVAPAVEVPETAVAAATVGDVEVPGIVVEEAFVIPGAVIDGGCVKAYDAPGGCLGAVEITGVRIPPTRIPAVRIPDREVAGELIEGRSGEGTESAAEVTAGARTEQVCRPETTGRVTPTITRPTITRPTITRPTVVVGSQTLDGGVVEAVVVDGVIVDGVVVDGVVADGEILDGRVLAPEAPVFEDDEETNYLVAADVLFDFDSDQLRPEAEPVLRSVVDDLRVARPDGRIEVGGHTDALASEAYNQDLSQRRAQTVADWLVDQGGIDRARLDVVGYGETVPVAPNTTEDGSDDPAGRQQNRRVVISAGGH